MEGTTTDILRWMLCELTSGGLEVAKIRTERGYVRVAVSRNAPWYQDFCGRYLSHRVSRRRRRARTLIKRRCTIRALERMIAGDCSGLYAERLLDQAGVFASGRA
jgi:hypothetical protein